MEILAFIAVILAIIFVLIVRDRPDQKQSTSLRKISLFVSLKKVLSDRQSWYLSLYSGLAFAPVSTFGGLWGVLFFTQARGFSHHTAATASSLIFLGFALGAPLFGWLSDKIGKRRPPMFWGTLTGTLALIPVLYLPELPVSLVFILLFLFGFAISSFLLCFSMIKENFALIIAGTSFGFMNAYDALFGAVSDPLTGKLLDLWWTGEKVGGTRLFSSTAFHVSLSILIVYLLLSLLLLKPIRETQCKQAEPVGLP